MGESSRKRDPKKKDLRKSKREKVMKSSLIFNL